MKFYSRPDGYAVVNFNKPKGEVDMCWGKTLTVFLLLLGGMFAGFGAFEAYRDSNIFYAQVIACIFSGIGLLFALSTGYIAKKLEDTNSTRIKLILSILLVSWWGVSGLYSFSFLATPRAVNYEIDQKTSEINQKLAPILLQSSVISERVVPKFLAISEILETEIENQSGQAMGGCHSTCRFLHDIGVDIEQLTLDLETSFDEKKTKRLTRSLEHLVNLGLQRDQEWFDKIRIFNRETLLIDREIRNLLVRPSPFEALNRAETALLAKKSEMHRIGDAMMSEVQQRAFDSAVTRVDSIINMITEAKNGLKTGFVTQTSMAATVYRPITVNFSLLSIHAKNLIDLILISTLLDTLAISLMMVRLIASSRKFNNQEEKNHENHSHDNTDTVNDVRDFKARVVGGKS